MRKTVLILIITGIFLFGCYKNPSPLSSSSYQIDTPTGMIKYLDRQNLPALVSVNLWENKYGDGLELVTRHYRIFTTLLEPLTLSQVPGFVESAWRAYNSQLPEPVESTRRLTIYLFAERSQWEKFTDEFASTQAKLYRKITAGAYYLKGACVVYDIGRERTFSVLGHEGWHQFNKRHFKYRLPSWLDEGIAMLFETSIYKDGFFYFRPAKNTYRLGGLRKTLLEDKTIPLETLVSINPGEILVMQSSDEMVTAFYSQAYALVRFLREADYGRRLGSYRQILYDGLKGRWPLTAENKKVAINRNIPLTVKWNRTVGRKIFNKYIDEDLEKIEEEYLAYCRKIVYRVRLK